ncbi:MAG: hypothetical protein M1834_004813 [Cirrosporium novae-zelandiae]|nr:MAG: hypothetical protein M1834_004813 [Cirrosporium novae-zelandiae]
MDVKLYVYDLSRGLARTHSLAFIGTQIDAIYHTSVVFDNTEFYFGQGIQTCDPGSSHHGQPIEVLDMGRTELPLDLIYEYLDSLKQVYTSETYDLFFKNCNIFSNDLCTFLVGSGIPQKILDVPNTFLNTPLGQMIRPQFDALTQAPQAPSHQPGQSSQLNVHGSLSINGSNAPGKVHNVTNLRELETLLSAANGSCAVIFFTSSTCSPCKIIYPAYDELAAEFSGKATLIKVDLNHAYDVGAKYQVRATPTLMTFLKGNKENEWVGANEAQLRGNILLLVQMAWPQHPHLNFRLLSLQRTNYKPVIYDKIPPLQKLVSKMGPEGKDKSVTSMLNYISTREASGSNLATLPDLRAFGVFIVSCLKKLPQEALFTVVDLFRMTVADPRASGYFAGEKEQKTVNAVFTHVAQLADCPYNLRVVTLHLASNLFTSSLFAHQLCTNLELGDEMLKILTSSFLDQKHANVRVSASSVAFNIAAYIHKMRIEEEKEVFPEGAQVELIASLLEALRAEESSVETFHGLLLTVGLLAYCAPIGGEVLDLLKVMDTAGMVIEKGKIEALANEPLIKEVGVEFLGRLETSHA